jgi:hypothetical protein
MHRLGAGRSESRRRLSYANVVSTLALVIAVGGGTAWAAHHYLITSTKQVKPSVLRALHGKNGKNGKNGTNGTNGKTGPTGSTGAAGTSLFAGSIPSGTTVTGAWGGRYIAPQLAFNNSYLISYSLPVKPRRHCLIQPSTPPRMRRRAILTRPARGRWTPPPRRPARCASTSEARTTRKSPGFR